MRIMPSLSLLARWKRQILLVVVFTAWLSAILDAQEIHIRVVNGHNGHTVTNECVNVWVGSARGDSTIIPTDGHGVAALWLEQNISTAPNRTLRACNGFVDPHPVLRYADTIQIISDYYIPCQAHPPDSPSLEFSVKKILQSGEVTGNACGKIELVPKPGELIFFVRPLHWWEAFGR